MLNTQSEKDSAKKGIVSLIVLLIILIFVIPGFKYTNEEEKLIEASITCPENTEQLFIQDKLIGCEHIDGYISEPYHTIKETVRVRMTLAGSLLGCVAMFILLVIGIINLIEAFSGW